MEFATLEERMHSNVHIVGISTMKILMHFYEMNEDCLDMESLIFQF